MLCALFQALYVYNQLLYTVLLCRTIFGLCRRPVCLAHNLQSKYPGVLISQKWKLTEWSWPAEFISSLIMNTSLKRRFILLERGRYIFHNRNNTFKCSIHSLSIYYGNWCCAKLRRQDNQCGFLSPRSCVAGKRVALILVVVTQNHPDTWTHGHLSRQNFLKCLR